MIIVKLKGGLGNQLFQYAVARQIANMHGAVLKIDTSFFETYELHTYSMWPYNIKENLALPEEVNALTNQKMGVTNRIIRKALHIPPKLPQSYIKEKYFQFDSDILNLPDDVYLDGYWQSEKYFADITEIIHNEFTVKNPQTGKDKELAEQINSCESVSLHIRRGSYTIPPYNAFHGICSLDYYQSCVEYISQKVKDPHFFIFSDDPKWALDNLKLPYPTTLIDHNDAEKDYEDLRLMNQCKYHIIANSTFSWWGAWLCKNPNKIVIAPRKWFNDSSINTDDLIPDGWIRI